MDLLAIGAVFVAAMATVGGVLSAQWIVDDDAPADFVSIQAAVSAPYVLSGDTILVRPGRYPGFWLFSKDLLIRSEAGPFETILDAGGAGSVVMLQNRSAATRIEGFTLTGGVDQTGGGVWIYGGAPVVTRNVIVGNSAVGGYLGYGYGGGIEVYGSAAVITRNVIQGNTALDGGGGIDVYYAGPSTPGTCCPLIAQNTIAGNDVTSAAGMGGGILVSASEPRITSNIVSGNAAASGGGIYVERLQGISDMPDVTTNVFHGDLPDEAASNVSFRLPSSNVQEDPRLIAGPGVALWPRSDSPAIDAAEAGLPAGDDLTGAAGFADSDLDGAAIGDLGAIESRGEITGLDVARDPNQAWVAHLTWDASVNPSVAYDLYASDGDPFLSTGGACLAPGLAQESFDDPWIPPPGRIRYYLVAGIDALEGSRGFRSDGTPRPSAPSCIAP